jgi:hypothetical protein
MLTRKALRRIARARLTDARALLQSRRYDGAIYLCGYSVEIALKARICKTLRWPGFPLTNKEFEGLSSFKVHKLDVLLHLSGIETKVKTQYFADWSMVLQWEPEARYKPVGSATRPGVVTMIQSAEILLKVL